MNVSSARLPTIPVGSPWLMGRPVVGLDAVGLDAVGLDTVGLDTVGLDTVGLNTVGTVDGVIRYVRVEVIRTSVGALETVKGTPLRKGKITVV